VVPYSHVNIAAIIPKIPKAPILLLLLLLLFYLFIYRFLMFSHLYVPKVN
jgi:hypothetical protein